MTTILTKEQICVRMTPPAYKALTELTTKFKNTGARAWTNSAVLNVMLLENEKRYLNLPPEQVQELFEKYIPLRGKK